MLTRSTFLIAILANLRYFLPLIKVYNSRITVMLSYCQVFSSERLVDLRDIARISHQFAQILVGNFIFECALSSCICFRYIYIYLSVIYIYPFYISIRYIYISQLSERLASLGIRGAQLRAPLKPSVHHSTIVLRGFPSVRYTCVVALEHIHVSFWH